jgi:hypothetical protein
LFAVTVVEDDEVKNEKPDDLQPPYKTGPNGREEYLLGQFAEWAPVDEVRELLTMLRQEKQKALEE